MAEKNMLASRPTRRIGRPSLEGAAGLESRILTAAWDLLLTQGSRELTIQRIARAAAVSKKTIYTRFRDRSDLLMRLLEQRLEAEESALWEDVKAKDFASAFCSVGERILGFLTSPEREAIGAVLAELPAARHDAWKATYAVGLRAIDGLLDHPSAGAALGHLNATTFRHAFLQCLIGHAENMIRAPSSKEVASADWMKALSDIFIRG